MTRRLVLALALVATTASVASAAQTTARLSPINGVTYPERAYTLSLSSKRTLSAGDVVVTENGLPVSDVSLVPETNSGSKFGIVLVIDASQSMAGAPINAALQAAQTLVLHLNANQPVAVIEFNHTASTVIPFTNVPATVLQGLNQPPQVAQGTHIYDAVNLALSTIARAHLGTGSIAVLSDGRDTGSTATAGQVEANASAAHVRVFTVGLRSQQFTPGPLKQLAAGTGGRYSEASSTADLGPIYDSLGAELASQYVLRYRSLAKADTPVTVSVHFLRGVTSTLQSTYQTPPLPRHAPGVYHPSLLAKFWSSSVGMVLIVGLASLLISIGTVLLLRPQRRTLRRRISGFVSVASPDDDDKKKSDGRMLGGRMLTGVERSLEGAGYWERLNDELEITGIEMPAAQILLWTLIATVFTAIALVGVSGSLLPLPIAFLIPIVVRSVLTARLRRVRDAFAEQLPDNLQVLSSAMRAGHSFVGALSVVVNDCPQPSRAEFQRVIADEQLGVPLEDALNVVAERMASRDVRQLALVASLQRQTGGNTAEVVDRVNDGVRERFELLRLVRTLTAQGRMSRWIVSGLPVFLLGVISVLNPRYLAPLLHHTAGQILLGVAGVLVVAGSLVIRKIVDIEV